MYLLNRHPSQSAFPHALVNELSPPFSGFSLCLKHSPDFFPFGNHEWIILITVGLNVGECLDGLFSSANLGQPWV